MSCLIIFYFMIASFSSVAFVNAWLILLNTLQFLSFTDMDDCKSSPCLNNGHCIDLKDNFLCQCKDGFWGKRCEKEVNECALIPCNNNATCIDKVSGFLHLWNWYLFIDLKANLMKRYYQNDSASLTLFETGYVYPLLELISKIALHP